MQDNELNENYQSEYKQFHSTETALVFVANDICRRVNEKKAVLLVLLNLSVAFGTVDHNILFKQLEIQDTPLSWFQSY